MKHRNIGFVLLTMLSALLGCSSTEKEKPQAETIKYVKTETIDARQSQKSFPLNGNVKEKSLTTLSFRVGGPLHKLSVNQGDFVHEGQVIAEIDQRDYELQEKTTKAQYTQAEGEYKRYKTLVEQNKIPKNTYEKIESAYLITKTAYKNAQNQLKDTRLKAPFSGYIYEKFVENFQTVGAGTPIVSLIDNSRLEAVVSVPENLLQRVKKAQEYLLSIDNADIKNLPVQLLSISEKTMSDGLYQVKFIFNNTNHKVAPGMTADVTVKCNPQDSQLTIPNSAIFHEASHTYVWIYNPSTHRVTQRNVSVELGGGNGQVIVTAGLNSGEQIVTAGVHHLVEGEIVKPIQKPSSTNVGGLL